MKGPGAATGSLAYRKQALRRRLTAERRALAAEQGRAAGEAVARLLLADPVFARARRVALYAALPDELPTRPLFEALARRGTALLLPRTLGGRLEFARVEGWSELRPGPFGVLEPPPSAPSEAPGRGDAVVLPGVAFDTAGGRLGRGGGHYDRAFPAAAAAVPLLVGAAYAFQVVEAVPRGSRDRAVDAIVTERALLWVEGAPS